MVRVIHELHPKLDSLAGREERDAQLLVDHQGKDAHLGGTALVELNGALLELGLGIERVPAKVNGAVAEVSNKLAGAGDVAHHGALQHTNEEEDLDQAPRGDLLQRRETVRDVGEGLARKVNVSGKADAGLLRKVPSNGKHGDTAVLQFNAAKAVELGLVAIRHQSQRIEEAERGLGTESILEGHAEGRGRGRLLRRSEGGSGGNKGGGNGELHG